MTLDEIKAFQKQHGYDDMPTGQFVQAINKKYGNFTNFMGSVIKGSIPEPIKSIGKGVANIFNNATKGTVYEPQNITAGYQQLANSPSPMYDYEQGAMGLLGQIGHNLATQIRKMIGISGIDPRTGKFVIVPDPNILREQMNMALNAPMMGILKNVSPKVLGMLKPSEYQLYDNIPKNLNTDDVLNLILKDRLGNTAPFLAKNPDLLGRTKASTMDIFNATENPEIQDKVIGYLKGTQLDNLSKALRDIQILRYQNQLNKPKFMQYGEPPIAKGSIDPRLAEYYKNVGE